MDRGDDRRRIGPGSTSAVRSSSGSTPSRAARPGPRTLASTSSARPWAAITARASPAATLVFPSSVPGLVIAITPVIPGARCDRALAGWRGSGTRAGHGAFGTPRGRQPAEVVFALTRRLSRQPRHAGEDRRRDDRLNLLLVVDRAGDQDLDQDRHRGGDRDPGRERQGEHEPRRRPLGRGRREGSAGEAEGRITPVGDRLEVADARLKLDSARAAGIGERIELGPTARDRVGDQRARVSRRTSSAAWTYAFATLAASTGSPFASTETRFSPSSGVTVSALSTWSGLSSPLTSCDARRATSAVSISVAAVFVGRCGSPPEAPNRCFTGERQVGLRHRGTPTAQRSA